MIKKNFRAVVKKTREPVLVIEWWPDGSVNLLSAHYVVVREGGERALMDADSLEVA